jgi:hypothetical protein
MIRRLQPGYNGGIGALHSHSKDEKKIRFCSRCEEDYGVLSRLGSKILGIGESRPADYDHWIQCHNCGQVYAKHETKVEPELEPIVSPNGKKGKIQGIQKKKGKGKGRNLRLKPTRDDIKDPDLIRELKDGAVLISYSSSDPL